MGNVSIVIIMLWSLVKPAYFEVMYWLTPATMQVEPMLRLRTVSSAVPVFLRRITEEDLRLYSASSNMFAVLSLRMLLLRDIYNHKIRYEVHQEEKTRESLA